MMIFLISRWREILIVFVSLILCATSFRFGANNERQKWQAVENKRLADTAMLILSNQKANSEKERKISNAHQIELSAIRNRYESTNKRLRYTTTASCDSAGMPETTTGTDATVTRAELLPESIEQNLRWLLYKADTVTAVARGLQELQK
jgi:hypothetical protein